LPLCIRSSLACGKALLSEAGETRSTTSVEVELKVLELFMLGEAETNEGSPGMDASGLSAPAGRSI